jgi:hypothetical protein
MPTDDRTPERVPVLDEQALSWAHRGVWVACVATYLIVFVGGIQAGTADLVALGRAIAFTLATAVVGRLAVGLASRATQPAQTGPMADQDGRIGSLVDLLSSPNVNTPEDEASPA